MAIEMDAKERELCKKTNQLVDELVDTCDETPFHKALIKILGNMKGELIIKKVLHYITYYFIPLFLLSNCSCY